VGAVINIDSINPTGLQSSEPQPFQSCHPSRRVAVARWLPTIPNNRADNAFLIPHARPVASFRSPFDLIDDKSPMSRSCAVLAFCP
jgi:hypothetical protein